MFEVYKATYKDIVVYVGCGAAGRHEHCLSGTSSIIDLNRIVLNPFYEKNMYVEVISEFNTKKEAHEAELQYIAQLQPIINAIGNNNINELYIENLKLVWENNPLYMREVDRMLEFLDKEESCPIIAKAMIMSLGKNHPISRLYVKKYHI